MLDISFDTEFVQNRAIFIFYIIYIIFLFVFIWRRFISIMQNELWKTKSMLRYLIYLSLPPW